MVYNKLIGNKNINNNYLFTSKDLVKLIIPLIFEQLLAVLVGLADSIMISSVGEAAVSGVSLMDNIYILLNNIFMALATGGTVVVSQYIGRKKIKEANDSADQLLRLMAVVSIIIMIITYIGKNFILRVVFGHISDDVYGHASTYLLICSASIPFLAIYNAVAAVFRAQMDSKTPMLVALIMNVINVVGNAILIYGVGLGTAGVAIPTLVSRISAATIIIVMIFTKKMKVSISKSIKFKFNENLIYKILKVGVPNGIENSLFRLGKIIVLSLVSTFGTSAIAANAISGNICDFQIIPGMALGFAMVTVVSRCIGAQEEEQAKYYSKKLMKICYVTLWGTNIIIFILLPFILEVYNLSYETYNTAYKIIMYHGIGSMIVWPLSFTLPNTFRATGDAKYPMVISIISMIICRIFFSYVIGDYMGIGVFGVWIAMSIDWIFRSSFYVYRYRSNKWLEGRL